MYVRPESARRRTVIPENYGGVAFSDINEGDSFIPPPSEPAACSDNEKKVSFPIRSSLFDLSGEDILLIGLIFLLAQSDLSNDIIPLLIVLLLC